MPNTKYVAAPDYMYCENERCFDNEDGPVDCFLYNKEGNLHPCPTNYSHNSFKHTPKCDGPNSDARVCKKNPISSNFSHWEPLLTKFSKTPNDKAVIKDAYECCNNLVTSDKTDNCGSLYRGGDEKQHNDCNVILYKYCTDPANVNELINPNKVCYNYAVENPTLFDFREICKDKLGNSTWDDICACHYPQEIYDNVSKKISEHWNIPTEHLYNNPECIYPKCKNNPFRDQAAECGEFSFVQCLQNLNIDVTDSNINRITVKQDADCTGKYSKKTFSSTEEDNNNSSGSTTTTNNKNDTPDAPPNASKNDKDKSEDDNTTLYLIIFIVVILCVGSLIYATSGDDETSPTSNSDENQGTGTVSPDNT